MDIREIHGGYVVKLAKGEKVVETLTRLCEEKDISAGWLSGLGAVKDPEIGYYPLEKREYVFKKLLGDFEVASLSGNVALVENKPFLHLHAVLSACDDSLACVGAHVKEAEVAVTLEVMLTVFDAPLSRTYDAETGLKLLQP